jgi:curved DNA-binding protein CbpA
MSPAGVGRLRWPTQAPHPRTRPPAPKVAVPTMTDPYAVLGVSTKATQAEITHAYRRQLRTHHPDTRSNKSTSGADERLRQILAAYALLRDPRRRADYDRTVHRADADPGPVQTPVTSLEPTDDQPPLWAGPVRWHR